MDSGSLAWVLTAAALVLFMTPGLAFFYGGMDRHRSVLNMLMMNFWCLLVVPVLWVAIGFSLAATGTSEWVGSFDAFFLADIGVIDDNGGAIATIAFVGMFAVITPALISGAVASRMKFSAWAVFVPVWLLLVLCPVFKVVFAGGFFANRGTLDFAGGTAIHVNAGIAALAVVLVLGRRAGWPKKAATPHSMPLVMLGTGILWFGWFGFNAGSALAANGQAAQAFLNTFVAAAAGGLVWVIVEKLRDGHATNLGAASGIVAGLVAVTPAAGFVSGAAPVAIGAIAAVASSYAVKAKFRFGYDDSLDVVGVHFVAGLVGSLTVGLFANPSFFGADFGEGLFYGGGLDLLGEQLFANVAVIAYSFVVTLLIALTLKRTIGLRVSEDEEEVGLDGPLHNETAYDFETITAWVSSKVSSETIEQEIAEFQRENA